MNTKLRKYLATATLVVACTGILDVRADSNKHASSAVVIEWNQLAQKHIAGPPFTQNRQYAMLHVAIADAVVAIEGRYEPFIIGARAPHGASAHAAAAQAAHDVLVTFFDPTTPAGALAIGDFRTKLAADLASVPPGQRWGGVAVGKNVAAWVIGWRSKDGFAAANPQPPPFLESTLPGIWRQTTAGAAGAAQFSKLGDVEPFGLLSATQFLPDTFPQLEDARYATDFNEVKAKGAAVGSTRSAAETRTAQLWANAGPWANVTNAGRIWQNVARDVAKDHSLSLVQTARLFALLTASIHDSVQTSQTSKFVFRLWRPVTAVAEAGNDNNPATDSTPPPGSPSPWTPLLGTPPYPSHSSNMTCIGAGAARMLRNVFGSDNKPFTATWYASNTVTPPATTPPVVYSEAYSSFWALAINEGDSRIWGGIHFRFEIDDSLESCADVADYIFDTKMQQSGR
jgi:hypothetical protein